MQLINVNEYKSDTKTRLHCIIAMADCYGWTKNQGVDRACLGLPLAVIIFCDGSEGGGYLMDSLWTAHG